jgi:hypothetical protein
MGRKPGKSCKQPSRVAARAHAAPVLVATSQADGERAKLAFVRKAESLGFIVRKPEAQDTPYEFLLDSGDLSWRVEVKPIERVDDLDRFDRDDVNLEPGLGRRTRCQGNDQHSKANQIDFLAAYLVPEDTWYIIPISRKALARGEFSGAN